jgi:rubredoxin
MNEKWKCTICGYIYLGANPPDRCPVCMAESNKYIALPVTQADMPAEKQPDEMPVIPEIRIFNPLYDSSIPEKFDSDKFSIEMLVIPKGSESEELEFHDETIIIVMSGEGSLHSTADIHSYGIEYPDQKEPAIPNETTEELKDQSSGESEAEAQYQAIDPIAAEIPPPSPDLETSQFDSESDAKPRIDAPESPLENMNSVPVYEKYLIHVPGSARLKLRNVDDKNLGVIFIRLKWEN